MSAPVIIYDGHIRAAAVYKEKWSDREREQIALAVAGFDRCEYCASAHTFLGKKLGLSEQETQQNLKGSSETPKVDSLIKFCLSILAKKGNVSDQELSAVRAAGFSDAQIVEIIANVCLNIFTNYFNHVAGTEIDFPKVSFS